MSGLRWRGARRMAIYVPLLAHVLPTLIVAYTFVIPGTCIAGWNQFTIGFAAANAGFVLSYVSGIRMALKAGHSEKP